MFGKYAKAWMAFFGLLLTIANLLWAGNPGVQLLISAATVLGVHLVPNVDDAIEDVATDVEDVQRG